MARKLIFALILVGVTFGTAASSEPPEIIAGSCETEPANPCDVVCGEDQPDVCDCPCWTDRRVEQSTCDRWNSIVGCWWF